MKELYIHHHLGLGDHFDCNGMVRWILEKQQWDKLYVFAKSNYFSMIEYMYRDTDDIEVVMVDKNNEYEDVKRICSENKADTLVVGHQFYPGKQAELLYNKNCWELFYDQLRIPYDVRYNYFYFKRDEQEEERVFKKLNPDSEPYIFIHEDASRGFTLNRDHFLDPNLKVIENDVSENIFHFIKIIENAQEVHCMESSFKTLIDFYCKQPNLFYHDMRDNQPLGGNSSKNWKVISYD